MFVGCGVVVVRPRAVTFWPFSDLVFGPAPFRFILVQLRSFVSGVDPWLCPFSGIDVGFAPILL